jgi:hypothetical protein
MSAKHRLDIRRHPDYIDPTTVAEKNSALAERIMEGAKKSAVDAMLAARDAGAHSAGLPAVGIKAFEAALSDGVMRYGGDEKNRAWWKTMNGWLDAADRAVSRETRK